MKLSVTKLYDSTRGENVDIREIGRYLQSTFGIRTDLRGDFWAEHVLRVRDLARELASIRVTDPAKNELNPHPLAPEIDFETRRLKDVSVRSSGTFYDATRLTGICWRLIPGQQRRNDVCHIILTRDLFGTWDGNDLRWHVRTVVLGYPCLVSSTGVVEGPARPPQFYLMKGTGVDVGTLKARMARDFVDYGDKRMTEVLKGYCAQAVFYSVTGEAFCEDPGCRLYNAHWQRELIHAQIESPYQYCERHARTIEEIRAGKK